MAATSGDEWKDEGDGSGDGWLMVTRAPGTGRSGRGGLGSGARELRGGGNCRAMTRKIQRTYREGGKEIEGEEKARGTGLLVRRLCS